MQVRRQYIPVVSKYDHLFSKNQKRNRVELISDFPKGNDAEVISSLQIHPYGWCSLSRNYSYDESSEWSCVHDIQELENNDEDEDKMSEISQNNFENNPEGSETNSEVPFSSNASVNSDTSNETSSTSDQSNVQQRPINTQNIPPIQIDPPDDEPPEPPVPPVPEDEIQIFPYRPTLRPSLINTEEILDLWSSNIPFYQRQRRNVTLSERPLRINTGIMSMNQRNIRRPNIKQNNRRLLYYCLESTDGKGFIKELCFNNDGRFIISPYKCGIRLLSFSKDCDELSSMIPLNSKDQFISQPLNEIFTSSDQHTDLVVSTKFSPRAPICVSGDLRGTLIWYQPQ